MRRRTAVTAAAATSLAVVAAVAMGVGSAEGQGGDGDDQRADAASVSTAEVTRRDLTDSEELDGTLGYGDTHPLTLPGDGTITWLADEGAIVERGEPLADIEGAPVVLLLGDEAMWRALNAGTSTGDDVRQLEENLVALGHVEAGDLGPDGVWTDATTAAVKAMQAALGLEETGRFDLGSIVFEPGAIRVAGHKVEVGAAAGAAALDVTPTTRIVTVDLAATRQGLVELGQDVEIELPDGTVVDGVVYSVSDVVDPPETEGGDATVEIVIAFVDPAESGTVDQAPVDVSVVTVAVEDALTVPVEALLALSEGGYAVETPSGALIGVELGGFADGYVEVTPTSGTLDEGDEVVVAG